MGLLAYYPLNGNTNDYSSNGNNATNYGATYNKDGKLQGCYEFNTLYNYQHTNAALYINSGLSTNITDSYTFSG